MDVAVYSHVEYSDCWPAFFGEFNKYCTVDFDNKYIFSNELDGSEDSSFQHVAYNDSNAYTDRLLSCLKQLGRGKVLFTHEDMILCDTVDENYLKEAEAAVGDVDFVKLLKGGSPKDTREDIKYKSSKAETGVVIRNATELINQIDEETVTNEMVINALNEQSQKIKELKKTNKSLIKDIEHMSNMYDQLWKKLERLLKGQDPNPTL